MAFLNDPQSGQDQQRNLLISVVLIFGLFVVWQAFVAPTPQAPQDTAEQVASESSTGEADPADDAAANAAADEEARANRDPNAAPIPEAIAPQRIITGHLDLRFTNVGGRAADAKILAPEQYIPDDDNEDTLQIFPRLDECDGGGYDCAAATTGLSRSNLPLSLRLKGYNELSENATYEFDEEASDCTNNACTRIVYRWTSADGAIIVERTYQPEEKGRFGIHGTISVRNAGTNDRAFDALELVNYSSYAEKSGGMFNQAGNVVEGICHTDGDAKTKPARKLDETRTYDESISYGGFNERYFLNAVGFTEPDGSVRNVDYCEFAHSPTSPSDRLYSLIGTEAFSVGAGQTKEFAYTWYLGPKRFEFLDEYPQRLSDSVQYGIFSFLSVPIRHVLIFLHGLLGNWGLAIIFLTLLIKLLLLPITTKAYKSMEAMKRVQPKLEALKKKFENDQQKMAEAQMKLFKDEGVNPLGGCLPLLLQMPVYFALYRTVWNSAELFQAPFYGWIQDLSQPDPFYILPVILGVMMFGQQKLMPNTSTNPQMKMMQYIMPLMFIPIMLFLPSGLVLYIFCNMLLTILQQLFIRNRYVTDEKA